MTNTRTAYERNSENIKKQIVELAEERADVVSGISPKVMSGKQQPTSGTIRIGKSVRFGWMSQNLDDLAKKGDWRVLEVLGRYRSTYYIDDKPQSPTQLLEHLGFDRHGRSPGVSFPTRGLTRHPSSYRSSPRSSA